MKHSQQNQSPKKGLVTDPIELKRLTDFFMVLIQIDQRIKNAKKVATCTK